MRVCVGGWDCGGGGGMKGEDVPLVEFMSLVFTRMPGELHLGDQVFLVVLL